MLQNFPKLDVGPIGEFNHWDRRECRVQNPEEWKRCRWDRCVGDRCFGGALGYCWKMWRLWLWCQGGPSPKVNGYPDIKLSILSNGTSMFLFVHFDMFWPRIEKKKHVDLLTIASHDKIGQLFIIILLSLCCHYIILLIIGWQTFYEPYVVIIIL